MRLHDYFTHPGALSVTELRVLIGAKSDVQVRQWRHGYANRQPSPEYAMAIEEATGGLVMRWDSRPNDWHRIWREIVGTEGAPPVPADDHKAA